MIKCKEEGSTTVLILGILLFLSVFSLGTYLLLQFTMKEVSRSENIERNREVLVKEAERVVTILLEDKTPYADSATDLIWDYIKKPDNEEVSITLKDLSSYYGLNWIRKEILDHSGLLRRKKSSSEFQQYRLDTGIHLDLNPIFLDFFTEQNLVNYFTPYNYFNINICDEFILESLFIIRIGDKEKAELFRQKIQNLWKDSEPGNPEMIEPVILKSFMGLDYYELFPVVNAEPVINIHFVPVDIIYQLFSYHYHDISRNKVDFLINNRDSHEWSMEDLKVIIGEKYKSTFLHHYLGVITWFWQIDVRLIDDEPTSMKLKWIIARIPQEMDGDMKKEFRLIEEEFLP